MCEPVCDSKLEAFLINCYEISVNRRHLYNTAGRESIKKGECGPRSSKGGEALPWRERPRSTGTLTLVGRQSHPHNQNTVVEYKI
jgi:hypothetical protein